MPGPCAHVGFGLALAQVLQWLLPLPRCFAPNSAHELRTLVDLVVLATSLLPDAIDKPLYWTRVCHATRSYGHTIVFLVLATSLTWSVCRGAPCSSSYGHATTCSVGSLVSHVFACGPEWSYAVFIGIASHLLADRMFGHVPLLWPLQPFVYPSMVHTRTSVALLRAFDLASLIYVVVGTPLMAHLLRLVSELAAMQ